MMRAWRAALVSLCLVGGLSGCASVFAPGYDAVESSLTEADIYARQTFVEARAEAAQTRPESVSRWWTQFGDPELDRLVALGLANNRNIDAAVATLEIARANVALSRSQFLPTDQQDATYQRIGAADLGPFTQPDQTVLDLGIGALWEIDLFGRIQRGVDVAAADFQQGRAQLADIQSLVVADIAQQYQTLRGLQAQMAVVRDNIATLQRTRELTIIIRDAGRGTDLDVERANEQLASTRAALAPLSLQANAALYRLGVLTGQTPPGIHAMLMGEAPLRIINDAVAIGAPGDLLQRRPDILAAEWSLVEANAVIGLRKSEAFPVVGPFGSFGLTAPRVENIFDSAARAFAIGPALSFSAVDFIRAEDRVDAAQAGARAELALYENTVLRALAEVETALSTENALQRQLADLREAKRAASEAARLARIRFENGATTFLIVLDAERRSIDADNALARTRTDIALAQVQVFRALRAGPP